MISTTDQKIIKIGFTSAYKALKESRLAGTDFSERTRGPLEAFEVKDRENKITDSLMSSRKNLI